jgi:peptidoglycan/LPS O-acetylase OafA/YrhL
MNRQFGALQGLAIVLVVVNHSITKGLEIYELGYPPPAHEGWLYYTLVTLRQLGLVAVPIFLFISGCFFAYSARGNDPKLSWKVVWTGLRHLLWPYLFWSVMFYVLIRFQRSEVYTPLGYLKNLVVGYPFHFIPLIAFYYVLSPLLVRLVRRFGFVLVAVIGLYQLILINVVFPGTLGFTFPAWMNYSAPPVLRTTLAEWAIYFPLGLVYSINAGSVLPWLQRARRATLAVTLAFFVASLLSVASVWSFPLAGFVCPLTAVLFSPTLRRDSIPMVRELEKIGRSAYGLYLTNLIVLELVLLGIHFLLPWLFSYQALLQPILFTVGLVGPLVLMKSVMHLPTRPVYRYVFG